MFTSRGSHHIENVFVCEMFTRKVEFTEFIFEKVFVVYFQVFCWYHVLRLIIYIVHILYVDFEHILLPEVYTAYATSIFIDSDYLWRLL